MRNRKRLLALISTVGLLLGLMPVASAAPTNEARAASAIAWLTAQTNPDGSLSSFETTPDVGLTLDAVFAGVAAKASPATISRWLKGAESGFADAAGRDPGLAAKAVIALGAAGKPMTRYGGVNPLDMTRKAFDASGFAAGTNAFGQAYGMLALARTGPLPPATVTFLARQQCAGGGFPMYFDADPAKHCDAAKKSPDPDGTAALIMALRAAVAKGNTAAQAPLNKAVAWLKAQQRADGSYIGAPPNTVPNSNSAGVAAAALSGLDGAAVEKITGWVSKLQIASGSGAGAVAYSSDAFARGLRTIGKGQWVRATTQAVFAFTPVDLYQLGRTAPYTLEGEHTVNGRQWRTTCEPYSATERCRAEIMATVVLIENGQFVRTTGWAFNNLTYLPMMTEKEWAGNPLAKHNMNGFTSGGRQWRTECHTQQTGRGACRSYTMTTVYSATGKPEGGYTFSQTNQWVFNNIVMFADPSLR